MVELENEARQILQQLRKANIAALADQWRQTAASMNRVLAGDEIRRTLEDLQQASAALRRILEGLGGPGQKGRWREVSGTLDATARALRRATQRLDAQLKALPPQSLAELARRSTRMVTTGEQAVGSLDRQLGRSLAQLEQSLVEVNRLLAETQRLVRSLRENPGRILERRRGSKPFAR